MEPESLRSHLSRFVTGVAVASYRAGGATCGLTVNSFVSVSLDPPLVLVSVARTARAEAHLGGAPFTVSVLDAAQLDVALHFAGRVPCPPGVAWERPGDRPDLAPALGGAIASFRCRPWQTYDGGDHRLHLGLVVEATARGNGEPLVFDRGRFCDGGAAADLAAPVVRAA